jgi:hypothetical protein
MSIFFFMRRWVVRNRSVIEIMVLIFTGVVSFLLVATGITIAVVEILDPAVDTDSASRTLFTAINIIIGALLGMLTVKGSANTDLNKRPDENEPKDITERTE